MDYGSILTEAWTIIWENKFLILLGVLVALGSSSGNPGGGGRNFSFDGANGGDFNIEPPEDFEFRLPEEWRDFGLPGIAVVGVIALIGLGLIVGLALWVVATVARGGLIAGASTIDGGGLSSFSQAWNAGWQRGWTLLGIGILPGIPGFILAVLGLATAGLFAGVYGMTGAEPEWPFVAGPVTVLAALACVLVPIALMLNLLRTFANRACMLEELGVFASYRRGVEVLLENFGPALILFLIQIAISIGIGIAMILPGLVMVLCCILWPLLLLFQGAVSAYFSTLWTLAWRQWTGLRGGDAAVVEASAPAV
jgi:hypothetical protein